MKKLILICIQYFLIFGISVYSQTELTRIQLENQVLRQVLVESDYVYCLTSSPESKNPRLNLVITDVRDLYHPIRQGVIYSVDVGNPQAPSILCSLPIQENIRLIFTVPSDNNSLFGKYYDSDKLKIVQVDITDTATLKKKSSQDNLIIPDEQEIIDGYFFKTQNRSNVYNNPDSILEVFDYTGKEITAQPVPIPDIIRPFTFYVKSGTFLYGVLFSEADIESISAFDFSQPANTGFLNNLWVHRQFPGASCRRVIAFNDSLYLIMGVTEADQNYLRLYKIKADTLKPLILISTKDYPANERPGFGTGALLSGDLLYVWTLKDGIFIFRLN